ncbi:MOZ/SAS family [Musa troglodytarum]|uniref:Histone acetyltransferase n=1 Tax=Musa troglodytarum TaxID=320322 RepID=A0A9E7ID85_9LILI|nr:MOZ/SAS family [Musa troglodytarum]
MGRSGSTVALPTVASNGAAATPPSGEAENPAKMGRSGSTVALPLEVGTRVMCQWRDQKPRPLQGDKLQNDTSSERKLMRHMLRYSYAKRDRSISFGRGNCIHDSKEQTICSSLHGHEELDAASLREHEEFTEVKNIAKIELGRYKIDIWYFSPFPPKCSDSPKLFFCEFCFKFMKRKELLQRHTRKCDLKHPPGDEIYRSGSLSMFEWI